ncbi:hypothetical protein ABZX12_18605 [Kribbella sp. NPDC003505]|uniref:hypothetical protein n=1 Tax=Kribbella sp. NPDC003505 TaxID=3154448 RepID=UPI0033B23F6F
MAGGGVRIQGLREVVRGLEKLGLSVDDLKDAFAPIAAEGARLAAAHVRSRSGRLAGTLRGNRAKSKAVITAGRASVPYAGPQNYGWKRRNIPAQGFMQRADAELAPRSVRLLEAAVNDAIRRSGL